MRGALRAARPPEPRAGSLPASTGATRAPGEAARGARGYPEAAPRPGTRAAPNSGGGGTIGARERVQSPEHDPASPPAPRALPPEALPAAACLPGSHGVPAGSCGSAGRPAARSSRGRARLRGTHGGGGGGGGEGPGPPRVPGALGPRLAGRRVVPRRGRGGGGGLGPRYRAGLGAGPRSCAPPHPHLPPLLQEPLARTPGAVRPPPPRERAWARVAPGSETSYNTLAEDRGGKAGARLRGPARKLHTNKREGSHAANHKGRKASCEAEYRLKGSGRNSLHFV
nr:translation initiation factor IF-2-like [Chlorocebus sabaeus]